MGLKRTCLSSELPGKIGQEVVLCGWIHSRRDHGKVIFFDLRDKDGLTQVVVVPSECSNYDVAKELRNEYVVAIKGIVNKRPKGTENPKIATGYVELLAKEIEVLNESGVLPFEIDAKVLPGEDVRLKYRYLDFRNAPVKNRLLTRHNVIQSVRKTLVNLGFLELETPFLTKSTPEGARDYLVPSRVNPGKFYALPQSPQLFKQLFMVGGLERYFQIVKCFRDEDLRADRQPEFTQIDLEASFVDEDDIMTISEQLMAAIFKEVLGIEITIPFPRYSYDEVMERYGTDKPDLRKEFDSDWAFLWVVDFPMFTYNEEEDRFESEHHPFTSPKEEDLPLLDEGNLDKVKARSYDLVLNGAEIGSGSVRIHKPQLQREIFHLLGLSDEEIKEKFGFFIEALSYGAPPHAGIAFGLDRLVAMLCGVDSIREVIPFPKTQRAVCPLTFAPSVVSKKQLDELGIRVVDLEEK